MVSNKKSKSISIYRYGLVFKDSKGTIRKCVRWFSVKNTNFPCRENEIRSKHPRVGSQLSITGSDALSGMQVYMQQRSARTLNKYTNK